jgi:predicted enzyme related to lactoylglutathione lyase
VDLATTDIVSAKMFCGGLFGWEAKEMPAGEAGVFAILSLEGDKVCGFYEMEAKVREGSISPRWFSYVSVEDADATASRAHKLGDTD